MKVLHERFKDRSVTSTIYDLKCEKNQFKKKASKNVTRYVNQGLEQFSKKPQISC